jgi:hypothetical protein
MEVFPYHVVLSIFVRKSQSFDDQAASHRTTIVRWPAC